MELVLAIMSNDDSPAVSSILTKENYQVTRLTTTRGFLRVGNTTLAVGTDDDKIGHAVRVIGGYSRRRMETVSSTASHDVGGHASFPVGVQIGDTTVSVIDAEGFIGLQCKRGPLGFFLLCFQVVRIHELIPFKYR